MHLLRWRAIQLALAEARTEMDLGGVDVAGARREPAEGEPTYGLYEHKRSYGARWVALAGAQERVARPWRYALGRGMAKLARTAGQGSPSR
jgi:lipid II:glycine glycyltransferase (peptidoglycan interpeptide bridge formation enzyme)